MQRPKVATQVDKQIIEAQKWKKKSVSLRGCHLDTVPASLCQQPLLTSLRKLDLSHNKISRLPVCLWTLVNLEHFTITHNHLHDLPSGIESLKHLKFFDASHNSIKSIPRTLIKLERLQQLNFSGNQIEYLDEVILNLPRLRKFFITKNPLRNIPKDVFLAGLVSMRKFFKIDVNIPSYNDEDNEEEEGSFLDELRNLKLRVTPVKEKRTQQWHISDQKPRVQRSFSFNGLLPSKISFVHKKPKFNDSPNLGRPRFIKATRPVSMAATPLHQPSPCPVTPQSQFKPRSLFTGSKVITSDYGSNTATDLGIPSFANVSGGTDSVFGDHGNVSDSNNIHSDSDQDHSDLDHSDLDRSFCVNCSDVSDDDLSACRELLAEDGSKILKFKNVKVTIPPVNQSGYKQEMFELDILEDLSSYAPDTTERTTHASQIVSLEPHGCRFLAGNPAVIDIPLAVPVDSRYEVVCLCSETSVGEPTDWQLMDSTCFSLLSREHVRIKTKHFSLFTIVVSKSYPVAERLITPQTGGVLTVKQVIGVEVNFPRNSVYDVVKARVKVVYGDEPYCLDFSHDSPRALATPVVSLEPHGCKFNPDAEPVTLKLPIPDCQTIMNRLNVDPHRQLTLWCSNTKPGDPLSWEQMHCNYTVTVDNNGNFCLETTLTHFSWYRALWDCLSTSLYECKIGVSYVYPYIQFAMMTLAMMDENTDSNSFGLEVVCYRSDRRFPDVGNYRHRVGGSLRPRMVKPGAIVIRLKSEIFGADLDIGEDQDLRKVEFGFRGREFEKQFGCVYKGKIKEKGVFGKVIVERMVQAGVMEPLFEFNLTKSGNEGETLLDSTDRWSLLAVKELASFLGISNDDNWKMFGKHLGFTNHEINHKLGYTSDPFAFMLSIYQTRGGTPEEFVQMLYEVGRKIRLMASGVKDKDLDQIGFMTKKGGLTARPVDSAAEEDEDDVDEDDLDESLSEVISRLAARPAACSTPKRKRSLKSEKLGPSAKRNRRDSVDTGVEDENVASDNSFDEQSILENRDEVKTSDLWRISEGLLQSWKSFGRLLNLPEEDLLCIQHANKDDTRECAYQMLLKFQERFPKKCRIGHLYRMLCENAMSGVARKFCRGITPSERSVC